MDECCKNWKFDLRGIETKQLEQKWGEICILINTKDRHSEVFGLLQSLRTQTYQNFSIIIRDESQTPLSTHHPTICLIHALKYEGHKVLLKDKQQSFGVCYARNEIIKDLFEWNPNVKLVMRCDDDVLLSKDYIERLVKVIDKGYDMASGVVPLLQQPKFERENKFLGKIINEHQFNDKGELTLLKDECGYCYLDEGIYPTPHFRTNCLMKIDVVEKCTYPQWLSTVGFREEGFYSFQAILHGFAIGIDVQAIAYHLQTPSGGVRTPDYSQKVQVDHESFVKWCKEHYEKNGDFLKQYEKTLQEKGLLK